MSVFELSNIKIRDFISAIESGKYRLPCFQRDFRWNPPKIKSLMNSIQHVYPAGSLLLLKVDSSNPLIPSQPFKYSPSVLKEDAQILVLDGQQRMTSCYSVFTNSGYYTYYINFIELMKLHKNNVTDIDFETLIVNKRHNQNPGSEMSKGLFPMAYLRDRTTMRNQIQIYVQDNQSDPNKAEECSFLNYAFGNYVDPILDYEFPSVILPDDSSMESVCKVFQTINTTGLKLSVFDICVAVFMPEHVNLKEKVKNSSAEKPIVKVLLEKDPTSALQVVALLSNKQPNSNTLPKELTATDISNHWEEAIEGIEQALILFDSFGAGTKKNLSILPYTPMVTIVAAVLAVTNYSSMDVPNQAVVERKIKSYFYTVALSTRYTEGTNAKINEDYKALNRWISNDVEPIMITHGVDWNTSKIIINNKNGAFGKAVLCMLNTLNPRDFYSQTTNVGVGEHIESCDLHHVFPKARYEDTYPDTINSVFNFTWLIKDTNVYIKDETTTNYLNKIVSDIGITLDQLKNVLSGHAIDNDIFDVLMQENFEQFLIKRADKIKGLFSNAGVNFKEVSEDEVEVEESEEEDED